MRPEEYLILCVLSLFIILMLLFIVAIRDIKNDIKKIRENNELIRLKTTQAEEHLYTLENDMFYVASRYKGGKRDA